MYFRQRGFNLLEVLIALVVLAVGLLGLSALQHMGLRIGHQSYERTQATLLIYDMIDRMRANGNGVQTGSYDLSPPVDVPPGISTDCATDPCSTAAMATYDMNQWVSTITGTATTANPGVTRPALAGGRGEIRPLGNSMFDIRITWQEQEVAMEQTVRVRLP